VQLAYLVFVLASVGWSKALRTLTIKTPDGVNVVVQKWGICEGPAILFVHGFSQSHLSWTKQVSSDLAHTFYMVTYDLRGHGQSDKPLEAVFYTESPRWADEVQAVMEGTGLRRPVLVGWSYGGRIVTDYLMKYGDKGVAGVAYVSANTNRDLNASSPALTVQAGMASDRLTTNLESTRAFVRLCFGRPPTQDEFETVVGFNMLTPAQVRGYMGSRATPYEATLKGLRCAFKILVQQLVKGMSGTVPVENFSRPIVEQRLHPLDLTPRDAIEARVSSPVNETRSRENFGLPVGPDT
jgi:non-heme chloroperoxidase